MSESAPADATPPPSPPLPPSPRPSLSTPPPPPPPPLPPISHDSLSFQYESLSFHSATCTEDYLVSGVGSIGAFLKDIMEVLTDTNTHKMGVCGKNDDQMASLLERVKRRVMRDSLFGVTVMVSIGKNPDLTRIQQDIADQLGLCFQAQGQGDGNKTAFWRRWLGWSGIGSGSNYKGVGENARQLYDQIMQEPKTLFILRDLQERLDLDKLGIPFGWVHQGCKLILTSESEDVLTHHMNTQRTIKV